MKAVAEKIPLVVITGHRTKAEQDEAFAKKTSKLRFPNSKHNSSPSRAVDIAPLTRSGGRDSIDWNNREALAYFGGYVMRVADEQGIRIRWGGDWNGNRNPKDDGWDMVHFELMD